MDYSVDLPGANSNVYHTVANSSLSRLVAHYFTHQVFKHSSLLITNTFITILGVNMETTTVTTIKKAACIVCLIVTITISNPTWITTYTAYLV